MSCCSPEYRKAAAEKEHELNQRGKDTLPPLAKLSLILLTTGAVAVYFFIH